jgi:hypothetical protein
MYPDANDLRELARADTVQLLYQAASLIARTTSDPIAPHLARRLRAVARDEVTRQTGVIQRIDDEEDEDYDDAYTDEDWHEANEDWNPDPRTDTPYPIY